MLEDSAIATDIHVNMRFMAVLPRYGEALSNFLEGASRIVLCLSRPPEPAPYLWLHQKV
jgi:hypothetical protein